MAIPAHRVDGQLGHTQDHNDITDVLADHESRLTLATATNVTQQTAIDNLLARVTALETLLSQQKFMLQVEHGAVAGTARPTGLTSARVQWVGSVQPSNAVTNDRWLNEAP